MSDVRLGALCWNQYTDWPSLLAAGHARRRLGYDTLWTWDHLYPIVGSSERPDVRGLADARRLGPGDRADPDRADGRREHVPRAGPDREDGDDPRPHLRRPGDPRHRRRHGSRRSTRRSGSSSASGLPRAAALARRGAADHARDAPRRAADGDRDRATGAAVRNDPPPIQARLPLLVGGGGEQVTLKLVARYADANNVGGGIEGVRRKEAVLLQHCETVGRDPAEIERTTGIGTVVIRDSREEAKRVHAAIFARNGNARQWTDQPVGTPEDVAEMLAPVPRDRLPPPRLRLPVAVRRGVDDAARDGGPPDPRARLTRQANGVAARVGRLRRPPAVASLPSPCAAARSRARWRRAFARLPQVAMSHQRRRPVRDAS